MRCSLPIWFITVTCRCDEYHRMPYKSVHPDRSQALSGSTALIFIQEQNKETKRFICGCGCRKRPFYWWQEKTMTLVSFKTQTQSSVGLACLFFFPGCVWSWNGDIRHRIQCTYESKSHTCIRGAALTQCRLHPGHSCKKNMTSFLVGNFLFMSECRSGEGDSGLYHPPSSFPRFDLCPDDAGSYGFCR